MHIISHKRLLQGSQKHPDAEPQLDSWFRVAKAAQWKSLTEVRRTYPNADGVIVDDRTYTVFDIRGNKYRLITEIFFKDRTVLVRHVLTHAEYDRGDWKK